MVGREGIEPSTNGLRGVVGGCRYIVNQVLGALANLEINVVRSQFGHSRSEKVTSRVLVTKSLVRSVSEAASCESAIHADARVPQSSELVP